jgi:hypothetical protein
MRGSMAIVFLTKNFSYGGLYHCPAHGILDNPVQDTIRRMLSDISPDIIAITPAEADIDLMDLSRVRDFLKRACPATAVGVGKPASAAYLRWRNGKAEINTGAPEGEKPRAAPESMRSMHHPSGRRLLGGAKYYGGRAAVKVAVRAGE